ncbi:AraC family transcriptional regulator [Mangrovitalea sediminis]|uniref:AraC family transcriptional regulator n=1 Tax=Mangrovitalea sediminis TaxID=1982043 RepID=UPI001304143C|nr:AraC family transcriptional regulator [Mangrovitalea sediminis]
MRLMTEVGREQGIDDETILAGTGVAAEVLCDPSAEVSGQQELRLIRNLMTALPNLPGLGIACGQRYHFTAFGALGFALASSRSLQEALDIGFHYLNLTYAFVRFAVTLDASQTCINVIDDELRPIMPENMRRFIVERDISALLILQHDILAGQPLLDELWLAFPEPENTSVYEALLGQKPLFGASRHRIALRRDLMDLPLPQANELAREAARQQCEALLDQRRRRTGLAAQVRQRLADSAAEMPTLEKVAGQLHMTPRTLRRHLKAADTTFIELREEVRQALAREYLSVPRLTVERIAERLGYAEPTSFINAYKRWFGRTPHAERLTRE